MESDALPNSLNLPLPEMMVDEASLTVWESKIDMQISAFPAGNTSSRRRGFSTTMLDY